jgi:3-phenylpropionate/trans-cinnamate dioxygenase ferredoxin reductase component
MSEPIVIVGGGLAGQRCAETLRRCGHELPIVMVCGEPHRPYDRPPLSKGVLHARDAEETLSFRSADWYDATGVQLLLGVEARHLDHRARLLELSDGTSVPYGQLLIATGARPRGLPIFDGFENVTGLRTVEDARRLRAALVPGARLLVIGAGFIGQEVASAARTAGVHTTVVEAAAAPMGGLLGPELGAWFADLHRSHGVELLLGEQVRSVRREDPPGEIGDRRRVGSVTLASGRTVTCDHVVLGVGVEPALDWLGGTELDRKGVITDVDGRTDIPGVYAAGDAAACFDPLLEAHALGSHWESAGRQGSRVAKAMLGQDPGAPTVSSFWSDLYDTRVQYLGHASLADELTFDGDPGSRSFTATFTRDGRPVAVLLAGRPQMLPQARALLAGTAERAFA